MVLYLLIVYLHIIQNRLRGKKEQGFSFIDFVLLIAVIFFLAKAKNFFFTLDIRINISMADLFIYYLFITFSASIL